MDTIGLLLGAFPLAEGLKFLTLFSTQPFPHDLFDLFALQSFVGQ